MITLIILATLCVSAIPTASASGNPVEFMWGSGYSYGTHGFTHTQVSGYVEVSNIAYNKNVTIHYTFNGTTWDDISAEYYKPTLGNKEAWYFHFGHFSNIGEPGPGTTFTFAIKYEVNGQTYWDNNNGQNYEINIGFYSTANTYTIGNCGLKVLSYGAASEYNTLYGGIVLKNLAYNKVVKVRYTTDNWATYKEISATYDSGLAYGQEFWTFRDESLPDDWETLDFAVYYTVNGTTYWDNNFEANYTCINYNL